MVTISLMPYRSFSHAGAAIQHVPASAAAENINIRRRLSGPISMVATKVAAVAPIHICPSMPMFQNCSLIAAAAANPTMASGMKTVKSCAKPALSKKTNTTNSFTISLGGTPFATKTAREISMPATNPPTNVAARIELGIFCRLTM